MQTEPRRDCCWQLLCVYCPYMAALYTDVSRSSLACARFGPPPRLVPSRSNGSLAAAGQVLLDSAARLLGGHSIPAINVIKT